MNAPALAPWWADRVLGLVSVIVGAVLGFVASQAKDWLDAKRSKKSFLIAVANELSTVRKQLQCSNEELMAAQDRFNERGTPPQFAVRLSTSKMTDQQQRDQAGIRLRSALRVTLEEVEKYQHSLDELCAKLPT